MGSLTEISARIDAVYKPIREAADIIASWPEYDALKRTSSPTAKQNLLKRLEAEGMAPENLAPILLELKIRGEMQSGKGAGENER